MAKTQIVSQIGEQELLLPARVSEALAANDRAKYLMSLLQAAREHAAQPDATFTDLRQERVACGMGDTQLDTVVEQGRSGRVPNPWRSGHSSPTRRYHPGNDGPTGEGFPVGAAHAGSV